MIAKYVLGDPLADPFAAGCAFTADFIAKRPDVAKRFAQGLGQGDRFHQQAIRRKRANTSLKNTLTPENVVDSVPMLGYVMVKDMSPKQIDDLQKFADFGQQIGVVPEKVDVRKYLQPF